MAAAGVVSLIPVPGMPRVQPGDDLGALIAARVELQPGDIVVVASKVVSKSEGCIVDLAEIEPTARADELAATTGKDPRLVELILRESTEVVRAVPGVLLVRHRLGFTSANGAIDASNVGLGDDMVLVLPDDPDASAQRLRAAFGGAVGVVIADTHGRAFRRGNVGVAVGIAGVVGLDDQRGSTDLFGRLLEATVVPTADLLAAAAGLVGGEAAEGIPVVVVRGAGATSDDPARAFDLLRLPEEDLFAGRR